MPRRRADDIQQKIYIAAKELLRDYGFSVRMEEIAERAGIGVASIYRIWETKEDLVSEIIDAMISEAEERVSSAIADHEDALVAMRLMNSVGFDQVVEYGQVSILTFAGLLPEPYAAQFIPRRNVVFPAMGHLMKRGIRQGYFPGDTDVRFMVHIWQCFAAPTTIRELLESYTVDEIQEKATNVLFRMLGYCKES